jgi:hypothetical protein
MKFDRYRLRPPEQEGKGWNDDLSEIGRVACTLVSVAAVTEGLEIGRIVASPVLREKVNK